MFLERRVYQGSSGKVYPLPFIDRISGEKQDVAWDAIHLENEFLQVVILPQIGGRIHVLRDKTNGCDLVYNQPVIKPALVGLAGPWISGGIEFNWPQHHRPSTFLPAEAAIERHEDGSVTVWLGEHDPMARMKGMHGVCLHPGRAVLEIKAQVSNRTPLAQTFLWWMNIAVRVHEQYQSFFPPDVSWVADHAKRATSEFPLSQGAYYGVDYGRLGRGGGSPTEGCKYPTDPRACAPNDLSWYANIPVPTSYMAMGSREDFFGGYDYRARAGLLHIADHRISPGKKQWTWGNHAFGYAWDRNLTDPDASGEYAPYIELMAGVFTDNQPDFSFLSPGETKRWSQYLCPLRETGPVCAATVDAALGLRMEGGRVVAGVSVTRVFPGARLVLYRGKRKMFDLMSDLSPGSPFTWEGALLRGDAEGFRFRLTDHSGREVLAYAEGGASRAQPSESAREPSEPAEIPGNDELFLTGLHLDQYRHATRSPLPYWMEALRRDPGDSRCNNAVGLWRLRRGEFHEAERLFRRAIQRLTLKNPNPADGEAYYHLGITLRFLGRTDEAGEALAKAAWNQAWKAPACHALAELDCIRGDYASALGHLETSLGANGRNLRALNLQAMVLRALGRHSAAEGLLAEILREDPLDAWARVQNGAGAELDGQTALDVALDCARAGFHREAIRLLQRFRSAPATGAGPMIAYCLGWLWDHLGKPARAMRALVAASRAPVDYCFPSRLEEILLLEHAIAANPKDARARYYLGNLFYDRRRHEDAIAAWEQAARLDPGFPTVWRNLGIGYYNVSRNPRKSRRAYENARRCAPADARILYERDQLWRRMAILPAVRLKELKKHPDLVAARDDLSLELCALFNQTGQPEHAQAILQSRRFQPWEGGEGQALAQHVRTHLAIGTRLLRAGDAREAERHFHEALDVPESLGEARHLLANASDIWFWLGEAANAQNDRAAARAWWRRAADFRGDFQEMSVRAFSEMSLFSILSLARLGRGAAARRRAGDLLVYARNLARIPAKIDYFATSLPTLLLFEEDLQERQVIAATFLEAQAHHCLGRKARAATLARRVLASDPAHGPAADFLSFAPLLP